MSLLNNNCLHQNVEHINLWNNSWNADNLYASYMESYFDPSYSIENREECKQLHRLYYELVIEPIMEFEWAVLNILQHFNYTFWIYGGQALDIERDTPIHPWEKGNIYAYYFTKLQKIKNKKINKLNIRFGCVSNDSYAKCGKSLRFPFKLSE